MNKFVKSVAEVLEVDDLSLDDDFRSFPDWCSLQGFGLLILMENDWNAPITVDRFLELRTVRDLCREAFLAFAASLFGVDRIRLAGNTTYGSLEAWDSVNHLRLVMETESRFGISYSLEEIPELRTLDDFLREE